MKADEFPPAVCAAQILKTLGGSAALHSVTHCTTRLRITLQDGVVPDLKALQKLPCVLGVINRPGCPQYLQLVVGMQVSQVFQELQALTGSADCGSMAATASGTAGSVRGAGNANTDTEAGATDTGADRTQPAQTSSLQSAGRALYARLSMAVTALSGIFVPVVGFFIIMGLINAATTAFFALYEGADKEVLQQATMDLYNTGYSFLVVMLGYTCARQLKFSPLYGIVLGLIYNPILSTQLNQALHALLQLPPCADTVSLALPVLPCLVTCFLFAGLMRGVNSLPLSDTLKKLAGLLLLLCLLPVTLLWLEPVAGQLSLSLCALTEACFTAVPFVTGVLLAGLWELLVSVGMHWTFSPLIFNNLATQGFDRIIMFAVPATSAMTGAMLALWRLTPKEQRSKFMAQAFWWTLAGVTEPALYGFILKKRAILLLSGLCAAIGAIPLVLAQAKFYAFGMSSFIYAPLTLGPDLDWFNMGAMFCSTAIGMSSAAVCTFLLLKRQQHRQKAAAAGAPQTQDTAAPLQEQARPETADQDAVSAASQHRWEQMMQQARQASATAQPQPETSERETQAAAGTAETATAVQAKSSAASTCNFASPLTGTAVAMADIPDPIFATGVIGPGAAISPDSDILLCPCTATVISNFELPHSVGLRLENGAEILIHAGINTVRLQGRGFSAPLPEGTVLQPGDEIMHFDRRLIESEGLNPMVIFAVTTPEFDGIMLAGPGSRVSPGEPFLSVCRKQA